MGLYQPLDQPVRSRLLDQLLLANGQRLVNLLGESSVGVVGGGAFRRSDTEISPPPAMTGYQWVGQDELEPVAVQLP
uniref:Uncharacterized protein n=1 Tax=Oryza punctata TaxID=4537 RepID=A0A0E0KW41_ORYPU